jgi:hypothetical protein
MSKKEVIITLNEGTSVQSLGFLLDTLISYLESSPPILDVDITKFTLLVLDTLADEEIRATIEPIIGAHVKDISITTKKD